MFPAFPFSDRLPWLLFAVSCAAVAWGIISESAEFITIGTVGIALVLFAFAIAPRILGTNQPSEAEREVRDAAADDEAGDPRD